MPSLLKYHQRLSQGGCPVCGGERDQPPYVQCSRCYTPKPKPRRVPPLRGLTRHDYNIAYRWAVKQACEPALAIGCCGTFHAVTQVPFRTPCCGRVLGSTAGEEHH